MPSYRTLKSYGERREYSAIAELLKRGFDVYKTLVDDRQIDCIIRLEKEKNLKYLDIQIKARSKNTVPGNAGRFAAMEIPNPRKNYYFIFYSEHLDKYWILPSLELVKIASRNKSGKNVGKYHICFTLYRKKQDIIRCNPKYAKFEDAFHLLK